MCVYIFATFFFLLLFSIGNRCQLSQKSGGRGAAAHSAPPPRFLRACVNISNLTCQDCVFINWLLTKRKGIYKILSPVFLVDKCFCFIYSNMLR